MKNVCRDRQAELFGWASSFHPNLSETCLFFGSQRKVATRTKKKKQARVRQKKERDGAHENNVSEKHLCSGHTGDPAAGETHMAEKLKAGFAKTRCNNADFMDKFWE